MIAKALDPLMTTDRRRRAGHDAEAQLAFYLKRAFGHERQLHVINGLRLETQDDAAQIDHLVIHPYGMIVVESKSVYGDVKINSQGEWSRSYRGRYQGMPSAKLQADRQVLFLQLYLEAYAKQLRNKRATFTEMPIDVFVAISDDAVIHRPQALDLSYLVKAEQISNRVTWLVTERKPKRSFLGLSKDGFAFDDGELAGVAAFLCSRHTPLTLNAEPAGQEIPSPPIKQAELPTSQPHDYRCKHCQSQQLEIHWGQYSYYFKCLECNKNTSISRTCKGCHEKERVRKEGRTFFGECESCSRSEQFFTNPV